MDIDIQTQTGLRIAGLTVRTSHDTGARDVGALWQRVMTAPGFAGLSGQWHAAYYDYESDFRGPYTALVGQLVGPGQAPEGLELVDVPAGTFAHFDCQGPSPQAVVDAWTFVWESWPQRDKRAYRVDFERYDAQRRAELFVSLQG